VYESIIKGRKVNIRREPFPRLLWLAHFIWFFYFGWHVSTCYWHMARGSNPNKNFILFLFYFFCVCLWSL